MKQEDIEKLVEIILVHRPMFLRGLDEYGIRRFKNEWLRILGEFTYEEVIKVLEDFFNDSEKVKNSPDAYTVRRECQRNRERVHNSNIMTRCKFCKKELNYNELQEHRDRCRSIRYLKRLYRDNLNREISEQDITQLYNDTQEDFDRKYKQVLSKFNITRENIAERLELMISGKEQN